MQKLRLALEEKKEVALDTYEITFSIIDNEGIHFIPGQYVWIILDTLKYPDIRGERRAFSITSIPENKNQLSILLRKSHSGFKKTLLEMNLGDQCKLEGPAGYSYCLDSIKEKHNNIVLIAGGVGIAPFLGILRSLSHKKQKSHHISTLLYINSSKEKVASGDEIQHLTTHLGIELIIHTQLFSPEMLSSTLNYHEDIFLICGAKKFINSIYSVLIQKGCQTKQLRFEQFYPDVEGNLSSNDFIDSDKINNFALQAVKESTHHIIITDSNGQIVFANETAEKTTGYTLNEMLGHTPRLWGGMMPMDLYKDFWGKKNRKGGFDGELINRRKNGEIYHVIAHISPIVDDNGVLRGYIGTEEDITPRIKLEQQLEEKRKQNEAMLLSIGEGVIAHDTNGKVVLVNKAAEDMLQYSASELIGHEFIKVVTAKDLSGKIIPNEKRAITIATSSKQTAEYKMIYVCKNQDEIIVRVVHTPIMVEDRYYGIIHVFRNITKEQQIDQAKTEFISLASHQLRTPLSTINWYIEMLISGDAGNVTEEQRKFLYEAYEGSQRMTKLVNALLNVSRIESGTFMVEPENIDIVHLTKAVIDETKPQITAKKLTISLEHKKIPHIMLDPNLMTLIMQNLITNAVKYTPSNGKISIHFALIHKDEFLSDTIKAKKDSILIQVRDTGMGIPSAQQGEVFKKLFRADNVRKADVEGTGLGLYLVKSVIEHSEGTIWFESEENKGTTFYVTLPLTGMKKKQGTRKISS